MSGAELVMRRGGWSECLLECPATDGKKYGSAKIGISRYSWHGGGVGCSSVWSGVVAAFLLRQVISHRYPGLGPFITFYPAVLLAALLAECGRESPRLFYRRCWRTILSFEPVGSFRISRASRTSSIWPLFTAFGVFLSLVIEKRNRMQRRLAAAREEAAVAEERRKAEEEREKAVLVEGERKRLFAILESLPAMTCLLSPDHKVVFANRMFREKFGEADGRPCHELCFGRANPCEFCEGFEPLKTGNAHRWEFNGPDGRVLDSYVLPFTDADGSPLILKVDTDITEQRQAQAELKQHRDHLENLVRQRTRELEKTNAKLEADIALRKSVELALRASEDRFRIALRNAPVSVAVQDRSLKYIWAYNQKAAATNEIIGKGDAEIFTAEETAHLTEIKMRILREGCELREQMWLERPSGRIFLDVTWSPVRDDQGEVVGVASATVDLTAVKISEEQLRLSEEKFARAFADNPAAIALARLEDMVFVDVNETLTSISGRSREEMIGHSAFELNLWPSLEDAERLKSKLLADGSLRGIEQIFRKKSGELVVTNLSAQLLEVNGERLVLAAAVDVSRAKEAEKVLQTTLQRFYTILSNQHSAILLVTDEGRTEFANQAFCDYYGLAGSPADQFRVDAPVMLERIKGAYQDPDQAGQRIREIVAGGVPVFSEDVSMRDGRTLLRDFIPLIVDGKSYGRLWVHRDISERKRAEEELKSLNRILKVLSRSNQAILHATDEDGISPRSLQNHQRRLRPQNGVDRFRRARRKEIGPHRSP